MATRPPPLTQQVHQRLADLLKPGDTVIDATAGNGHDTLFLARHIGETGRVIACDIQQAAIDATRARLAQQQLLTRASLLHKGHEHLAEIVPRHLHGQISAILFNLGYLPGADKSRITRTQTTLQALDAAAKLLRPTGILSVIAYPGHPGGDQESLAARAWFKDLEPNHWQWNLRHSSAPSPTSPFWLWAEKMEPIGAIPWEADITPAN
jgi:SAM-dependent methyltransferase